MCAKEISIDDGTIIVELDLAETLSITNAYRLSNNPAYVDGFVFGHGAVYFKRPDGRVSKLFGEQQIGNMFVLLERFLECVRETAKGQREIGAICAPGHVGQTLHDYYRMAEEEDRSTLSAEDYEALQNCIVESRDSNSISCYSASGSSYLEVTVGPGNGSNDSKLASWHREIVPTTLGSQITAARDALVDSYARYSEKSA